MSTFVDLDSFHRNRENYPNENSYELTPAQVEGWSRYPRNVRALPQNPNTRPLEFTVTINIKYLTVPYTEEVSELPRVYLVLESQSYKDKNLINTISGTGHADIRFICVPDKIQNDRNGDPLWIHYKCNMEQVMRYKRDETIKFELKTRSGVVLNKTDTDPDVDADPLKQTMCTFEVTPYIIDGDYDNHLLESHVI